MPLLLKMPFSFRALNGVNTCVNMWVFVPLKVCQIFEVCQSVLLRDSHFVSITDLNLESMRHVCVFPSRASLNYMPYFFSLWLKCPAAVVLISSAAPSCKWTSPFFRSCSPRFGTNSIFCSSDSGQESKSGPGTILLQRRNLKLLFP